MSDAQEPTRKPIQSYEDIEAYQRAIKLVAGIHNMVTSFPEYEKYDLASQMRRAAKSVPANIAEGYVKRSSVKEFKHYLRMAMASANEMRVHLKLARELSYVDSPMAEQYLSEYDIVGRQLNRLISVWQQFTAPGGIRKA